MTTNISLRSNNVPRGTYTAINATTVTLTKVQSLRIVSALNDQIRKSYYIRNNPEQDAELFKSDHFIARQNIRELIKLVRQVRGY